MTNPSVDAGQPAISVDLEPAIAAAVEHAARLLFEAEYPPGSLHDGRPAPVWDERSGADFADDSLRDAWRQKARQAIEPAAPIIALAVITSVTEQTNSEIAAELRELIKDLRS